MVCCCIIILHFVCQNLLLLRNTETKNACATIILLIKTCFCQKKYPQVFFASTTVTLCMSLSSEVESDCILKLLYREMYTVITIIL